MNFTTQSPLYSTPIRASLALGAALGLGIAADLLLRAVPWGLNVLVWTAAASATALWLLSVGRHDRLRHVYAPAAGMLLFAALFVLRDSAYLQFLNLLGYFVCLSVALHVVRQPSPRPHSISDYSIAGFETAKAAAAGSIGLLSALDWDELHKQTTARSAAPVLRGAILSLPLLLIFATLFRSADPIFARWMDALFGVNLPTVLDHVIITIIFGWMVAGVLYYALQPPRSAPERSHQSGLMLGGIEAVVIAGAVSTLFAAFVLAQTQYLFGGRTHVLQSAGVTFADYARQGFFELAFLAAFVLALILGLHWLIRNEPRARRRQFEIVAGVLVILVFTVIVSALDRMRLYQSVFGLTELRFFTSAFILWLALTFGWLAVTVLRNRRNRFASGMVLSGLAAVLVLNAVNPDHMIARTNIERATEGHSVDVQYLGHALSADAVPFLIKSVIEERVPSAGLIAAGLLSRNLAESDIRTFNWSRYRAYRMIRENRIHLTAAANAAQPAEDGASFSEPTSEAPEPDAGHGTGSASVP